MTTAEKIRIFKERKSKLKKQHGHHRRMNNHKEMESIRRQIDSLNLEINRLAQEN